MARVPHVLNEQALTFFDRQFQPHLVPRESGNWAAIVELLNSDDPDMDELLRLADPVDFVQSALDRHAESGESRLPKGTVSVTRNGVKYNGEELHGHLVDRLLDVLNSGFDVMPWVRFLENVMQNPSETSRDELYLFLEKSNLPITEDGHFLAFKRVSANYTDCHTGTIDNSVGKVVEMDRSKVDPNRYNLCSTGLHFCSRDYLRSFGGARLMVVKINPADVVSIPADYDNSKGRTWRYEVVDEIEEENAEFFAPVISIYDADDEVDYDYGDVEYGYDDEPDTAPDEDVLVAIAAEGIVALRRKASELGLKNAWKGYNKAELVEFITKAVA